MLENVFEKKIHRLFNEYSKFRKKVGTFSFQMFQYLANASVLYFAHKVFYFDQAQNNVSILTYLPSYDQKQC